MAQPQGALPSTLIRNVPDQLQINQMSINRGVGAGGALGPCEPAVATYGSLATAAVNTVPRAAYRTLSETVRSPEITLLQSVWRYEH